MKFPFSFPIKRKDAAARNGTPNDAKPVKQARLVDHSAVIQADPYSYLASHRRIAWLNRTLAACLTASVLLNITSITAISSLLPLKETQIALLRVDPNDDRIYQVEPISVEVDGYELMVEKIARRYVREILAIDSTSQNSRFAWVRRHSDSDFFNAYIKAQKDLIERALKDGLNRSITVISASEIVRYDDVLQIVVEFEQVDKFQRGKPTRKKLRAYMELAPRPQEVKEVDKFENPLGIRVLSMAVKERAEN